ncbi:MAG: hypothetical protein KQJ78_05205 [Deltaproteobacteria bacterium]|nr:hypothetical protein [Deltaproteobacteria bacterium]
MLTSPGDVLLLHHKGSPVGYARVEEITADVKPGWWQIRLLILSLPQSEVTWILREEYIDGAEFTMGGEAMRLERLPSPAPQEPAAGEESPEDLPPEPEGGGGGKVFTLRSKKK